MIIGESVDKQICEGLITDQLLWCTGVSDKIGTAQPITWTTLFNSLDSLTCTCEIIVTRIIIIA